MSAQHTPPAALGAAAFTAQQAVDAGLTARQLDGSSYRCLLRGAWQRTDVEPSSSPVEELHRLLPAIITALPGTVASHSTAALLLGMRLPQAQRFAAPLHLTRAGGERPRARGIVGHDAQLPPEQVVQVGPIPVTSPARTLVDLAAMRWRSRVPLLTEVELVGLVDGLICTHRTGIHRGRPPRSTLPDLLDQLQDLRGRRGVRRVRLACERARVGADSLLETRARLLLEDAGMTEWELDVEVRGPDGSAVHPDLADRARRLSVQIDGPHHDDERQRRSDVRRARITESAGWIEVRLIGEDLMPGPDGSPPAAIGLVRAALLARGGSRRGRRR